jgi:aspartyl-tRNA synthetase
MPHRCTATALSPATRFIGPLHTAAATRPLPPPSPPPSRTHRVHNQVTKPPPPTSPAPGVAPVVAAGGLLHADVLWVTDFPLFECAPTPPASPASSAPGDDAAGVRADSWSATHHPFTAPHPDDTAAVWAACQPDASAAAVRALHGVRGAHYDLVANGWEIGGGSQRIHDAALQLGVLQRILRVGEGGLEAFGPLLRGLATGAPPHAGAALGLDRLLALLACTGAAGGGGGGVRDVIAFPKSAAGRDGMSRAPAPVPADVWAEYGLAVR